MDTFWFYSRYLFFSSKDFDKKDVSDIIPNDQLQTWHGILLPSVI